MKKNLYLDDGGLSTKCLSNKINILPDYDSILTKYENLILKLI